MSSAAMNLTPAPGSLYPEQTTRVIIPATVSAMYTKRLYLRPVQLSDASDIFEYRSRQDVANYLWPKVPHKEVKETENSITKMIFRTPDASGAVGRQFAFAIIQRDDPSQKVIGMASVNALVPAPSIGFGMHPNYWNKGYVSEAVAGVIDAWWRLDRKELESIVLATPPERLFAACNKANVGSMKVLLKNRFELYQEVQLEGDTVALFVQDKP
ncbi:hypothetical protein N7468_010374 [Penicillium chermesinum]|uniref:N-acetyltransferase domain-containing protein n=1 Tax=Penicillium chermesinum TaxID=63820 RepID=A0A9W9NCJ7_9EURO|nr:uncharacterized protein N7468_010374 [Penicillium chermesinum]KAJ5217366.1 hypothetical protein N7468_010374 [Penicillium chermesinum]